MSSVRLILLIYDDLDDVTKTDVDDASLVLGTSGVIFIVTEGFLPNPMQGIHAFCHAMPNLSLIHI